MHKTSLRAIHIAFSAKNRNFEHAIFESFFVNLIYSFCEINLDFKLILKYFFIVPCRFVGCFMLNSDLKEK